MITFNRLYFLDVTATKLSTLRLESMIEQLDRETINKDAYTRTTPWSLFRRRVLRFLITSCVTNCHELSLVRSFRTFSTCHVTSITNDKVLVDRAIYRSIYESNSIFRMDIINETVSIKIWFSRNSFNLFVSFYRIKYGSEWNTILERKSDGNFFLYIYF